MLMCALPVQAVADAPKIVQTGFFERRVSSLPGALKRAIASQQSWGIPSYRFTFFGLSYVERQAFTGRVHFQRVARLSVTSQEFLSHRILEVFLHSTAHRSSAVDWIVSLIDQKIDCGRIQVNLDILGAYPSDDFCHFEVHNLDQLVPLELAEHDDVI